MYSLELGKPNPWPVQLRDEHQMWSELIYMYGEDYALKYTKLVLRDLFQL